MKLGSFQAERAMAFRWGRGLETWRHEEAMLREETAMRIF
jgi:hypothetical protein